MRKRELRRRLAATEHLLAHVATTLEATLHVLGYHFQAHEDCGCEGQFFQGPPTPPQEGHPRESAIWN